jgi:hypothetical protein
MTEVRALRLLDYSDLILVVDYRVFELGYRHLEVDDLAGYASGYTGKLLCRDRKFGLMSLQALLGALKLDLYFWHRRSRRALPVSWGGDCLRVTIPLAGADWPDFMQKVSRLRDAIGLTSLELSRRADHARLAVDKRAIGPTGLPHLRDVLGADMILVPTAPPPPLAERRRTVCAIGGCLGDISCRGLCSKHYARQRRGSSPALEYEGSPP